MSKRRFITFIILFNTLLVLGQVDQNILPQLKASDSYQNKPILISSPDTRQLLKEDAANTNTITPYRYGVPIALEYSNKNAGDWTQSDSTATWTLSFESPGALSLSLIFDQFHLPNGSQLFITDELGLEIQGAYTELNNNVNKTLASNLIHDDIIRIECTVPNHYKSKLRLRVSHIVYGYKDINFKTGKVNESGDCNIDINCPLGGDWQKEKRSVVRILSAGSLCTGTLINTATSNGTPYVLTANHCYDDAVRTPANSVFLFNYDSPVTSCASTSLSSDPSSTDIINGAIKRANSSTSDFYLTKLNSAPPVTYNAYYAGWDWSGLAPDTVTGIHHPSGDVKKICQYTSSPTKVDFNAGNGSASCWNIHDWTFGVTEGGSSGSAIFSENHHIVGHLYGGAAACLGTIDNGTNDYYGRFDISWTGEGTNSTRLSNWLDPLGSGLEQIDGYDPNIIVNELDASLIKLEGLDNNYCDSTSSDITLTIRNAGRTSLVAAQIIYGTNTVSQDTIVWTGNLDSMETETLIIPDYPITFGEHTFWATIMAPNGLEDENHINDSLSFSYAQFKGGEYQLKLSFDCYPEETSWSLLNDEGFLITSGDSYGPANSDGNIDINWCLEEDCYTFILNDDAGDGIDGKSRYNCGQNGYFEILDSSGTSAAELSRDDFGTSTEESFCVTLPKIEDYDICDLVHVFPTVASNQLSILLQHPIPEKLYQMNIYNALGQLVLTASSDLLSLKVDIENLPNGSYYIQLTGENWSTEKRFIIIN